MSTLAKKERAKTTKKTRQHVIITSSGSVIPAEHPSVTTSVTVIAVPRAHSAQVPMQTEGSQGRLDPHREASEIRSLSTAGAESAQTTHDYLLKTTPEASSPRSVWTAATSDDSTPNVSTGAAVTVASPSIKKHSPDREDKPEMVEEESLDTQQSKEEKLEEPECSNKHVKHASNVKEEEVEQVGDIKIVEQTKEPEKPELLEEDGDLKQTLGQPPHIPWLENGTSQTR